MPMTDADIVARLRHMATYGSYYVTPRDKTLLLGAADRFERLTAEVERLKAAHEQDIEAAVRWACEDANAWYVAYLHGDRATPLHPSVAWVRFKAQKGGSA